LRIPDNGLIHRQLSKLRPMISSRRTHAKLNLAA
jgi:hypothetical protein